MTTAQVIKDRNTRRKVTSPNLRNNQPKITIPGMHCVWVNDEADPSHPSGRNLDAYYEHGYNFVTRGKDDKLEATFSYISGQQRTSSDSALVHQTVDRSGMKAYLMAIPEEDYQRIIDEDSLKNKETLDEAVKPTGDLAKHSYGFEHKVTN